MVARVNVVDDSAPVGQKNLYAVSRVISWVCRQKIGRPVAVVDVLLDCVDDWIHH
jgi:hypothetical protein